MLLHDVEVRVAEQNGAFTLRHSGVQFGEPVHSELRGVRLEKVHNSGAEFADLSRMARLLYRRRRLLRDGSGVEFVGQVVRVRMGEEVECLDGGRRGRVDEGVVRRLRLLRGFRRRHGCGAHKLIDDLVVRQRAQHLGQADILRVHEPAVEQPYGGEDVEGGELACELEGGGGVEADVDMHAAGEVWEQVEEVCDRVLAQLVGGGGAGGRAGGDIVGEERHEMVLADAGGPRLQGELARLESRVEQRE